MVRIAEAEAPAATEEQILIEKARAFVRLKDTIAALTKEANTRRDELAEIVNSQGEEDESGNLWLELPEAVDGFVSLKRERRVSQTLNPEAAEDLLTERGLKERCYRLVPVLDEDEVMACVFEELLTVEDLEAMYPKKISWAFVPSKRR